MNCVFCDGAIETLDHLFFQCPVTQGLWCRLLAWLGIHRTTGSWHEEFQWACKWARKKTNKRSITCCIFAMVVSLIWRERNNLKFQSGQFQSDRLCKEVALHIHIRGRYLQKWRTTLDSLNNFP
ncbi:hypothetical protein K7X08_030964 [Anisodus acutangulus]|uniref:Reverse transcriptase zinc-binding domain-containing protein n=1 Tax=Anisodus acutangulus TaxID=402998 RepID=A0A9Q1N0F7_9SOLA|nr:hypothetical protein K7X08_030964 [Anisodus acutangulus]